MTLILFCTNPLSSARRGCIRNGFQSFYSPALPSVTPSCRQQHAFPVSDIPLALDTTHPESASGHVGLRPHIEGWRKLSSQAVEDCCLFLKLDFESDPMPEFGLLPTQFDPGLSSVQSSKTVAYHVLFAVPWKSGCSTSLAAGLSPVVASLCCPACIWLRFYRELSLSSHRFWVFVVAGSSFVSSGLT